MEREVRGVDHVLERRVAPLEEQHELELGRGLPPRGGRESRYVDELEPLRKREVLLQEPIALEHAQADRQQRLRVGIAGALDPRSGQELMPRPGLRHRSDEDARRGADRELVEPVGDLVGAGEEQAQPVDRQLVEDEAGRRPELEAHAPFDAARNRQLRERQVGGVGEVLGGGDLERPERDVVRGAELARGLIVLAELAAKRASRAGRRTRARGSPRSDPA